MLKDEDNVIEVSEQQVVLFAGLVCNLHVTAVNLDGPTLVLSPMAGRKPKAPMLFGEKIITLHTFRERIHDIGMLLTIVQDFCDIHRLSYSLGYQPSGEWQHRASQGFGFYKPEEPSQPIAKAFSPSMDTAIIAASIRAADFVFKPIEELRKKPRKSRK